MRPYSYVGPHELRSLNSPTRQQICDPNDVRVWIHSTQQQLDFAQEVTATFIIDSQNRLWIANRHSEHVACAAGLPVLSAGEITFQIGRTFIEVVAISNQSTGYCPEPSSWPNVANALTEAGLAHPDGFTTAFHFRRCNACGSINLVKDAWFVCDVCESELNTTWNFDFPAPESR